MQYVGVYISHSVEMPFTHVEEHLVIYYKENPIHYKVIQSISYFTYQLLFQCASIPSIINPSTGYTNFQAGNDQSKGKGRYPDLVLINPEKNVP